MCSSSVQRIAAIGQAIDDLAAEALAVYSPAPRRSPVQAGQYEADTADAGRPTARPANSASPSEIEISDADQVVIRLAKLWAVLAELDPEVARRLPTYEA